MGDRRDRARQAETDPTVPPILAWTACASCLVGGVLVLAGPPTTIQCGPDTNQTEPDFVPAAFSRPPAAVFADPPGLSWMSTYWFEPAVQLMPAEASSAAAAAACGLVTVGFVQPSLVASGLITAPSAEDDAGAEDEAGALLDAVVVAAVDGADDWGVEDGAAEDFAPDDEDEQPASTTSPTAASAQGVTGIVDFGTGAILGVREVDLGTCTGSGLVSNTDPGFEGGAASGNRTPDNLITSEVLYRLS